VPSEKEIEGCRWGDHKEILLAGIGEDDLREWLDKRRIGK